jgi:hypothetical protein
MQVQDTVLIERGNVIIVETSLSHKISKHLSIIMNCTNDETLKMNATCLRTNFKDNIKDSTHLYLKENRKNILDIYNLFKYRNDWEEDFVYDYNLYWDALIRYYPLLPEVDWLLEEMEYIVAKLEEIVRLNYEKMKKDNMPLAEDLAKYVFKLDRLVRFSEQYGLHDFTEYLDILD